MFGDSNKLTADFSHQILLFHCEKTFCSENVVLLGQPALAQYKDFQYSVTLNVDIHTLNLCLEPCDNLPK